MKEVKKGNSRRTILIMVVVILSLSGSSCSSVTVTTANTTAPVLIGSVKKVKGTVRPSSDGNEFDFDNVMKAGYFIVGNGNGGTNTNSSSQLVSSNEFDGELLMMLDTAKEHAEVKQINIGSYSTLNIFLAAFHKTWAGIEGKIVKKENLK